MRNAVSMILGGGSNESRRFLVKRPLVRNSLAHELHPA